MRTTFFNPFWPSSTLSMNGSSCIPGSSTPANNVPFTVIGTSAFPIEYGSTLSVHCIMTGARPQGTLQLLASNDDPVRVPALPNTPIGFGEVSMLPIAGTSASILPGLPGSSSYTGTSAQVMYNISDVPFKWWALQFIAATSSVGAMKCRAGYKGWGV